MKVEEICLFGVYMPAPLLWACVAVILTYLVRPWLHRLPLHAIVSQPAFVELGIFVLLWWGIALVADAYLPPGVVS